MDSNSFLMGPLDVLASWLFSDGCDMSLLKQSWLCKDEQGRFSKEKYLLLNRKGFHNAVFKYSNI